MIYYYRYGTFLFKLKLSTLNKTTLTLSRNKQLHYHYWCAIGSSKALLGAKWIQFRPYMIEFITYSFIDLCIIVITVTKANSYTFLEAQTSIVKWSFCFIFGKDVIPLAAMFIVTKHVLLNNRLFTAYVSQSRISWLTLLQELVLFLTWFYRMLLDPLMKKPFENCELTTSAFVPIFVHS